LSDMLAILVPETVTEGSTHQWTYMYKLSMIYSSGLVPACEELRKLRAEGNLEAQDDEFEDVDEEHYENMDGENGVSNEDLGLD